MSSAKVAVVTGANKGIGYAIVKGLCEKFNGKVYLTARDENRGNAAVEQLKKLGLNAVFHQLDITDQKSITVFRDFIKKTDGGIDLLVNNAAIAFKNDATEPFNEQAEVTVKINYFSTLQVCETLFPILRSHARVVNISSSCGHLSRIPSPELRAKFGSESLTVKELSELMNQFVLSAKDNKHSEQGWGKSAYVVSKVGLSALTHIQQRMFNSEPEKREISVNSVHPGYVDTDMSSHKGQLTIEEGASAPLFLALDPHGLKGKYIWCDSTVVDWFADATPAIV